MEVTFAWFLEFGLGSFSALWWKISNVTIFKTLLLSQFSSDSSNLCTMYVNHGAMQAITFWAICQKLKKNGTLNWIWTQDHIQLEIPKCYFSHNFHWRPSKLSDNIGYHGKSKCLLEYCNMKLASGTQDSIFYSKIFKIFLCTRSSVQAERQGAWASCFLQHLFSTVVLVSLCNAGYFSTIQNYFKSWCYYSYPTFFFQFYVSISR